ncbi:ankyrin repeat domain-containing protein [Alcanivorax sp. JB21]|nr:ankyrin repeat domain-containing protein [Alcanivorax limicola]
MTRPITALLLGLLLASTPLLAADNGTLEAPALHQSSATRLSDAITDGDLGQVRSLLAAGHAVHSADLPLALHGGRLPLIRLLADALPERHRHAPDLLATYLAEGGSDPAVVEWLLLDGAALEGRNSAGDTAVLAAARQGQHALVQMLLAYGADPQAISASGCDLGCFYRPVTPLATRQWPTIDQRPAAFMLLAVAPALLLYFPLAACRLHRRRATGPLTLGLIVALGLSISLSASLFFRCDPCLVAPGPPQLLVSAAASLLLTLAIFIVLLRRPFFRTF